VIAPEPRDGINRQSSLGRLLRNNLAIAILIFACLEIWRPCCFLTDDNLTGAYPVFTEIGHHFLSGRSPFLSDYLFGGNYDLLRDPSFFCWHPVYLLASLLAGTSFRFAIIDVDAMAMILLATAGFVTLAHYLRRELSLKISDGWVMFYCLSFSYSAIVLTTGASWFNFLGSQSALPWLALGILQKTWRRGIGLVALFSVHEILAGHPSPNVSTTLFFTIFALGVSISRRSFQPLSSWLIGTGLAVIILSPLLLPAWEGFLTSTRSLGLGIQEAQSNRIPFNVFSPSFFCGMTLWIFRHSPPGHVTYLLELAPCAAAWSLIPALANRARWRGLDMTVLGMMILGMFLVCRPNWLGYLMVHVPMLKSMRWPFRELLQFQFFFHLFLVLRSPESSTAFRRGVAVFGASLFVLPMLWNGLPPTLNATIWNRELLFSGQFDDYWKQVRPLLKPTDRVAVLMSMPVYLNNDFERPHVLLSSHNLAILARVVSASGYSPTAPRDQLYLKTKPAFPNGAFEISQKETLLQERPDLKFITLESLSPLKITLSSKNGPTTDLTPYVPAHPSNR